MANLNNENQNGVFGGVTFGENNNGTENTSFFGEFGQTNNNNETTNEFGTQNTNNSFGSFSTQPTDTFNSSANNGVGFKPIDKQKAVTKQGLWTKIRSFLFQEIDLTAPIKVELTPYQQKVENEINEFLHQEVSFKSIAKLFGKK